MNFGGTLRLNKFACFTIAFILFLIIYWRSGCLSHPSDEKDLVNLKTLLKVAIHVAEMGGQEVVAGKSQDLNIKSKGKTKEGANDPVTNADYASHCIMYYGLKNVFPKVNIVSEEHLEHDGSCQKQNVIDLNSISMNQVDYMYDEHVYAKDVTIWIDPLDATQEYTEGLYKYVTTMVCVAINGVPILGVIHYPFTPLTYWGWTSKTTSPNIAKVDHKEENKQQPRVVVSRSHPGKVEEIAKQAFGPKTAVTQAAGAGYKVMGVVNGDYDVYLHATAIKKWDICAGNAIINTLNGKMTTAKGEAIDYSAGSDVKVSDGLVVTHYDHKYYLDKVIKVLTSV